MVHVAFVPPEMAPHWPLIGVKVSCSAGHFMSNAARGGKESAGFTQATDASKIHDGAISFFKTTSDEGLLIDLERGKWVRKSMKVSVEPLHYPDGRGTSMRPTDRANDSGFVANFRR